MIIERCYTDESEWSEIDESTFIIRVEHGGYIPRGSGIKRLENNEWILCDIVIYRKKKLSGD